MGSKESVQPIGRIWSNPSPPPGDDIPFMTRSIESLVRRIRWLAESPFSPKWLSGRKPVPE